MGRRIGGINLECLTVLTDTPLRVILADKNVTLYSVGLRSSLDRQFTIANPVISVRQSEHGGWITIQSQFASSHCHLKSLFGFFNRSTVICHQ